MKINKLFNVCMVVFLLTMATGGPINVAAQSFAPIIAVFIAQNGIGGFHWPEGASVTLTIDDPDNGTRC